MNLQQELNTFLEFSGKDSSFCSIAEVGPSILRVESKKTKKSDITLGLLALVHGNEYLGLPILNSLIKSLLVGTVSFDQTLYFGLGNIPAAIAGKRFIDEDLNRCFGKTNSDTQESSRARILETFMLNKCDYLLDIHQTISAASDPFFIFQYTNERCLNVMSKWNPGIPTVLQEDQIGENTGLSTDEYLRFRGKFGAALELGQLGTNEHFVLGLDICKNALAVTDDQLSQPNHLPMDFPVYRLKESFKAENSSCKLDSGWKNLKPFYQGQKIGESASGSIYAPETGVMLFPRYRPVSAGDSLFHYCIPWTTRESVLRKNNFIVEDKKIFITTH